MLLIEFWQAALLAQCTYLLPCTRFVFEELQELRKGATQLFRNRVQVALVIVDDFQHFGEQRREIGVLGVDDDLPAATALLP